MARRSGFRTRGGGMIRLGYGITSISAGISKMGRGSLDAWKGAHKPYKPLKIGKGLETVHSGYRLIRGGGRHITGALRTVRGTEGHSFHGNQYVKVASRARQAQAARMLRPSYRRPAARSLGSGRLGGRRLLSSGRGRAKGRGRSR